MYICFFSLIIFTIVYKYPTDNIKINLYNNINPPSESSVINKLPWEDDEKFKEYISEYQTPILMAAYCTVLKNPMPGEEDNVHLAAKSLSGTVVMPGEVFSQNKELGPYTKSKGYKKGPTYIGTKVISSYGGGVCKVTSTLYNVSVLSNLKIVERHNHNMPVSYVPYGQDAAVAYGGKDFKFLNNTSFPILIWCQEVGDALYMAFYGRQSPPKITWNNEILKKTKAPIVYRYNPNIEKGKENIIIKGIDGATVKSWITIYNSDGSISVKELGISHYNPRPYLIEKNS